MKGHGRRIKEARDAGEVVEAAREAVSGATCPERAIPRPIPGLWLVCVILISLAGIPGLGQDDAAPPGAETEALDRALAAFEKAGADLESRSGALADAEGDFWKKLVAGEESPAGRLAALRVFRKELESRLRSLGIEQPGAIVERANERFTERRTVSLYRRLKCSCPTENFSRTLEGCWEPCVEAQRELLAGWLAAGHSDEEIVKKMVEHVGTDRVLVTPRGSGSAVAVFAVAALGLGLVVFALLRLRRPRASSATEATRPETGPGESGAGETGASEAEDSEFDRRIEEDLRRQREGDA